MPLTGSLFVIVPLISVLCNIFLFLTVCAAKKTKLVYSFLILLATFTAWTAGSLFMRLGLYPGIPFWYSVSTTGIFCVPFCYYNFVYHYSEQRGTFLRNIWFILSIGMALLNLTDLFITHPTVTTALGEGQFSYTPHIWVILPIGVALAVIASTVRIVYRSIKYDGVAAQSFRPLFIGLAFLLLGPVVQIFPGLGSLPTDTLACVINALCIYYALYRRRIITLTHVASRAPSYAIAAVFTTFLLISSYSSVDQFYIRNFPNFLTYKDIVLAILFSTITMAVYNLTLRLMNNLFVRGQAARDAELKRFSLLVSKTLDIDEVVAIYKEFLQANLSGETAHIALLDEPAGEYRMIESTDAGRACDLRLPCDSPLIEWLTARGECVSFEDFRRTGEYKSMWDSEKHALARLNLSWLLPVMCDGVLVGITLFSSGEKRKKTSTADLTFMESAVAVLSISIRNARMYVTMRNEARRDALTGLYNRRHFEELAQRELDSARADSYVLALLNLDDFHLFNELYGTQEGDVMLHQFAQLILSVLGNHGSAFRYSGKEFVLSLPFCDAPCALEYVTRIRDMLARLLASQREPTRRTLTFSAGLCAYPVSATTLSELLTNANMAVFRAKRTGKNKIITYAGADRETQTLLSAEGLLDAERKRGIADSYASTIYALTAAVNAKDHYTFNHSNNVSEYAAALAQHIGLDPEHVEIIRQAGLLHDIGKIGIPETILSKTERLNDEEYTIMKTHVERAIDIIRFLPSLDYVIPSAIAHHEHWDGRGYPRGLSGESIPIGGRCLCIADSFDAMVARRPYKAPLSVEVALAELERNLGRQFDPELGRAFIDLVRSGQISVNLADDLQPV